MPKDVESTSQRANFAERGSRFLRNINILGAVALTGAAVLFPEYSAPLLALAAIDVVQAVFFHATERLAARRQLKPRTHLKTPVC